jgi:class 3 adenylate cyclase
VPLYMDIHTVDGVTADDVAKAHFKDVEVQGKYGVEYLKYWLNEDCNKLFCLVEAPDAESARCVHEEAHGLAAEKLIEVDPDLVESFMGNAPPNEVGAALQFGSKRRDSGVRTILFTDIVGSTEMADRHGDDAAVAMLRTHDAIVRKALKDNSGREVKHTGDGIMAAFMSPASAVRAACQMQADLRAHVGDGTGLPVVIRIGISAGEPVEDAEDLFGCSVQLAARLCAKAEPGQILVSNVVAGLCIGKGLKFTDLGECELKGFDHPIETHAVELTC